MVEAVQGPVALNRCAVEKRACSLSGTCAVHPVWVRMSVRMAGMLAQENFRKLAGREKNRAFA